ADDETQWQRGPLRRQRGKEMRTTREQSVHECGFARRDVFVTRDFLSTLRRAAGTLRNVMPAFSKAAVEKIIDGLNLEESNRVFAAHWLSLWDGDALPPGARFSPAKLKAFLPGLLKFEVVPDTRVIVRLAGTGYSNVLKKDPTGSDWIEAA